jgi:hypothetical protein
LTDNAVVARELPLPETEAEDANVRASILLCEDAPDERRHAHDLETVVCGVVASQPLRHLSSRPEHVGDRGGGHTFKDVLCSFRSRNWSTV